MTKTQKILILGAGSFAVSIAELAEDIPGNEVVGYVVNLPPYVRGQKLGGKPIYWIDDLDDLDRSIKAVCALGSMKKISLIEQVTSLRFEFANIIHPSAYVSHSVKVGDGVIISSGVQIAANVTIGSHVILNRGALIGHNVSIHDYAVISPGVNIASNAKIGARSQVRMGSILVEHVHIGEGSYVGAGSLVTKDVPDHVKVVGMPAQIIERNYEERL